MSNPTTLLKEIVRRETENVVNRLHRHCRIGRVTKKVMIHGGKMVLPPSWAPDPVRQPPTWSDCSPFYDWSPNTATGAIDQVHVPLIPAHGMVL